MADTTQKTRPSARKCGFNPQQPHNFQLAPNVSSGTLLFCTNCGATYRLDGVKDTMKWHPVLFIDDEQQEQADSEDIPTPIPGVGVPRK